MALFRPKSKKKSRSAAPRRGFSLFAGNAGRSNAQARKARSRRQRNRPFVFSFLSWCLALAFWGAIALGATTFYVFANLDNEGLFKIPDRAPGVMLLASDGHIVAERGSFFGDEAKVSELPQYLPQAVMAIEDRRFYSHWGIDLVGTMRALMANYEAGRVVQGGSTLTQQLAKNLFLKPERTFERKFQEAVLALWLEANYSKDEILQLYLNRVYFGAGAYGVQKAAQKYFGKDATQVSLGEAAILAAVLKAPTRFNPLNHPERARQRANLVVQEMIKLDYISQQEATFATGTAQTVKPADYIPASQYIVDWVIERLPDLIGKFDKSIVVETTLDRTLQTTSERTIRNYLLTKGPALNTTQGAMVVMDPTGAVRAMVGGKSYIKSQFNRVVKASRQPGSAFKPFVYLAALEQGMSPDSIEFDAPIKIGDWTPSNYGRKYRGQVTLRQALALSLNTVAAKLGTMVGPTSIVTTAHRLGVNSKLEPNASLALGTSEVNLLELTAAYAPFANGGTAVIPHIVKRIMTRDGKLLYERKGDGLGQVVSAWDVGAMNDMLHMVVTRGTGRRAQIQGQIVAGKTGTSQDHRDAWFIGYSAHMVAGVWVGNDDNSPTKRVTGGNLPAMIWQDVMQSAHQDLAKTKLPGETHPADEYPVSLDGGRSFVQILQNIFGGDVPAGSTQNGRTYQQYRPSDTNSAQRRNYNLNRTRRLQDSR